MEKGSSIKPSDPPETRHEFFKGQRVRLIVPQNLQQNTKTAGLGAHWEMGWCVGHREQPLSPGCFPTLLEVWVHELGFMTPPLLLKRLYADFPPK